VLQVATRLPERSGDSMAGKKDSDHSEHNRFSGLNYLPRTSRVSRFPAPTAETDVGLEVAFDFCRLFVVTRPLSAGPTNHAGEGFCCLTSPSPGRASGLADRPDCGSIGNNHLQGLPPVRRSIEPSKSRRKSRRFHAPSARGPCLDGKTSFRGGCNGEPCGIICSNDILVCRERIMNVEPICEISR
jgi:hypothetical protein